MDYILDMHTHTLASGHAYSTIREMAQAAAQQGLKLLGISEHGPQMPGSCDSIYFRNLKVIPRKLYGIELLFGAEANIIDYNGGIDLDEKTLGKIDYLIASMHPPCLAPGSKEEVTNGYCRVMDNPYVKIIGHPDDDRYPVDFDLLVRTAKEKKVLLEINNYSLTPNSSRTNGLKNVRTLLECCKKYHAPVIVGSDAHMDIHVGEHSEAYLLMKELDFPEELVTNTSVEKVKGFLLPPHL